MTQGIKPSQFIYTHGPGSILEGINGSRIILSTGHGLFHSKSPLTGKRHTYVIIDDRMSKNLLDGNTIYKLPVNAEEEDFPTDSPIYKTNPFPLWSLCPNANRHKNGHYVLYRGRSYFDQKNSCPECDYPGGGKQAVRYVMACPNGHLDEINWDYLVHGKVENHSDYFIYKNPSGGIKDIEIECPKCGKNENFGSVYLNPHGRPCTGRFPEREEHRGKEKRPMNCSERMTIVHKSSANLRIPWIKTLISIKSGLTDLDHIFQKPELKQRLAGIIISKVPITLELLGNVLDSLVEEKDMTLSQKNFILSKGWQILKPIIENTTKKFQPMSYSELLLDEFISLMKGSKDGIPIQKTNAVKTYCEMIPHLNKTFECENGLKFKICPVTKLSTVSVQKGYSRQPVIDDSPNPKPPTLVSYEEDLGEMFRGADNKDHTWFPGVLNHGEGLFIRLDTEDGWHPNLVGDASSKWMSSYNSPNYQGFHLRDPDQQHPDELHPVFVWWHTLSHLLIRAIGEDAGFSSASVRERVYVETDGKRARGGILLYATQSGADGSMGGLLALAPYFDRMLEIALDNLRTCSGDPLCFDKKFEPGSLNGACCFGCTMNSETSCEYRNYWLDRHVLLNNAPCTCAGKNSG